MKTLADLTAPQPVIRKVLEADVQSQCVDWARARGFWARKFSSISQRSVPDYLFARGWTNTYREMKFAVEFKAPGKKSTTAQCEEQLLMRAVSWYVFECDSFEVFKEKVLTYEGQHKKF